MAATREATDDHAMGLRWIVLASALVTTVLVTFIGVAWLLAGYAALSAVAVAAMARRYRRHPSTCQLLQVVVGVLIAVAWATIAVLVFKSGDTSLAGALRD